MATDAREDKLAESGFTAPELTLDAAVSAFATDGWATTCPVVAPALLDQLCSELGGIEPRAGIRNLLDHSPAARALARSAAVRHIPEALLGTGCFVTRAILFDKTPDSNWKVPWHQDVAIAVAARHDEPGFGPWSVKDGVVHVQPPAEVLAGMVTVRVHLDDCAADNGPVRVLPRTHSLGKLSQDQIEHLRGKVSEVACTARRGGLLAFRPLLLHASSASTSPSRRRVAHFEFAAASLPGPLDWQLRWL
jgi:ectoine hydroxylase-related dioxygenase (phytanoyl-CoA dioxygenase family)